MSVRVPLKGWDLSFTLVQPKAYASLPERPVPNGRATGGRAGQGGG